MMCHVFKMYVKNVDLNLYVMKNVKILKNKKTGLIL